MNKKKNSKSENIFDKQFEELAKRGQAKKYKVKGGLVYTTNPKADKFIKEFILSGKLNLKDLPKARSSKA